MSYTDDDSTTSNESTEPTTTLKMNLRDRTKQKGRIRKMLDDDDFTPEKAARERRKFTRKPVYSQSNAVKNSLYDESGKLRYNGLNLCDCLEEKCPGCFYPCPNCSSPKCGPVCRVHRKFTYDSIEFDGKEGAISNRNHINN